MSQYDRTLPEAGFVGFIPVKETELAKMLAKLVAPAGEFPGGSSFAVTADMSNQTYRKLWLTPTSAKRLGVAL